MEVSSQDSKLSVRTKKLRRSGHMVIVSIVEKNFIWVTYYAKDILRGCAIWNSKDVLTEFPFWYFHLWVHSFFVEDIQVPMFEGENYNFRSKESVYDYFLKIPLLRSPRHFPLWQQEHDCSLQRYKLLNSIVFVFFLVPVTEGIIVFSSTIKDFFCFFTILDNHYNEISQSKMTQQPLR